MRTKRRSWLGVGFVIVSACDGAYTQDAPATNDGGTGADASGSVDARSSAPPDAGSPADPDAASGVHP